MGKNKDYFTRSSGFTDDEDEDDEVFIPRRSGNNDTPVLNGFTKPIKIISVEQELVDVYQPYINDIKKVLLKEEKSNIALVGENGIGKDGIVRILAYESKNSVLPSQLKFDIMEFDLNSIISGTRYRGQLEERLNAIINEIDKCKIKVLLYIPSLSALLNRNDETSAYISYALSALSSQKKSRLILPLNAVEKEEIFKLIPVFTDNFSTITVYTPTKEDTFRILKCDLPRFGKDYGCEIGDDCLRTAIELADMYIERDSQPLKTLDLLEDMCASIVLERYSVPDKESRELLIKREEINSALNEAINKKTEAVKAQTFELAASYRDEQRQYTIELEEIDIRIEAQLRASRRVVTISDIEYAVAKYSGVDLNKVKERERVHIQNPVFVLPSDSGLSQYEISQTQSLLNDFGIKIKVGTCFVLIPHTKHYDSFFDSCLKPVLEELGLSVLKASDIPQPGNILSQIWHHIRTAEIIIADISDNNTNVIFELGLCYGIKRCPILITKEPDNIPFNLRNLRYIEYEDTAAGASNLSKKLKRMVEDFLSITRANK